MLKNLTVSAFAKWLTIIVSSNYDPLTAERTEARIYYWAKRFK